MIRPPVWEGAAFSDGGDGDVRHDLSARKRISELLGIREDWAVVRQVHGGDIVEVDAPGDAGDADALWTSELGLPLAVFTADCFGVVLHAERAVGVAHCGWRGTVAHLAEDLRREMTRAGHEPVRAVIGPGIGPCCFEVGPDVSQPLQPFADKTTWGTTSVDLAAALRDQLDGIDSWAVDQCTHHLEGWFSHRRDGDMRRLAAIGWVP